MIDDFKRYLEHMPIKSDVSLSVLKGHLLIEELIWSLIRSKVVSSSELEKTRFSFEQLTYLARALSGDSGDSWVWDSVKKLNRIRNLLAHRLEPKNLNVKLSELYISIQKGLSEEKEISSIALVGELHWYLGALYLSLSARLHVKPKTLLGMSPEELAKIVLNE
ncbi:hypothetical protein B9K09_07635 [Pseudomonas sp. M30-35]|nr:hypothetical protein B9K09_07635 [Pseudomonas sp. M30-35]